MLVGAVHPSYKIMEELEETMMILKIQFSPSIYTYMSLVTFVSLQWEDKSCEFASLVVII